MAIDFPVEPNGTAPISAEQLRRVLAGKRRQATLAEDLAAGIADEDNPTKMIIRDAYEAMYPERKPLAYEEGFRFFNENPEIASNLANITEMQVETAGYKPFPTVEFDEPIDIPVDVKKKTNKKTNKGGGDTDKELDSSYLDLVNLSDDSAMDRSEIERIREALSSDWEKAAHPLDRSGTALMLDTLDASSGQKSYQPLLGQKAFTGPTSIQKMADLRASEKLKAEEGLKGTGLRGGSLDRIQKAIAGKQAQEFNKRKYADLLAHKKLSTLMDREKLKAKLTKKDNLKELMAARDIVDPADPLAGIIDRRIEDYFRGN